ncbi:mannosyltransferase family protein [Corynebacterium diphtheriae]|uniref:mannosyltransferase family protein n=2 Tax=Corynebacterium diphtheriae TaxID=1717 RepID=UPI002119E6ED|nr:mannosyltransferase family protein [Corynebacterium diphtheriae]
MTSMNKVLTALALVAATTALRLGAFAIAGATAGIPNAITTAALKWDADQYLTIARDGYLANPETSVAFFPGLPMAMRMLSVITHLPLEASGLIIVTIATAALALAVMRLAELMGIATPSGRIVATLVVLLAPMSGTFTMVYTEAPFMALSFWAIVAMMQERWRQATLLVALAGLVRLTGIDLVATFAIVLLLASKRHLPLAVIAALPTASYLAWASWVTRDAGGYFGIQEKGWGSGFDGGISTINWIVHSLHEPIRLGYILSSASMIIAIIALVVAYPRLPLAPWLFSLFIGLNVLLSGGIMHSRPRLLLPMVLLALPFIRTWPAVILWSLGGLAISAYMIVVFPWAI